METKNGLGKVASNNGCTTITSEEPRSKRKVLCSVCEGDFVKIVREDSSVEISAISGGKSSDQSEQAVDTESAALQITKRRRSVGGPTPVSVHDEEVYHEQAQISRYFLRRGALCNPEKMPIPQSTRECIENDIQKRRRSVQRKFSNFLTTKLDLDRDVDLF